MSYRICLDYVSIEVSDDGIGLRDPSQFLNCFYTSKSEDIKTAGVFALTTSCGLFGLIIFISQKVSIQPVNSVWGFRPVSHMDCSQWELL